MKTYLKPKEGLKVRDAQRGDHLPPEGREVELDRYWRRRIADGDVVEVRPPQKPKLAKEDK